MNVKPNIAVIGLGYVGLPLAVEFGKKQKVILSHQGVANPSIEFRIFRIDVCLENLECFQLG